MRTLTKLLLSILLGGLSLILVACGGGGGGSSSATGSSVKLSGVVATGAVTTSSNPAGVSMATGTATAANCTNLASTGTALGNAIVIAVDKQGNTYTTSAAADGSFSLNAPSGVDYALVFIDPHTLTVLGSLVQATTGNTVGAIPLSGNTSMGRIVINGTTGQAFAQADACGSVPTTDGSSTFTADPSTGTISSDNITTMQSNTVTNSGTSSLSNISVVNFMGDPDTWHISVQGQTGQNWGTQQMDCVGNGPYDFTADFLESDLTVERAVTVPGPDGTNVAATKEASLGYYMKVSNVTSSPAGADTSCWQQPNGYVSDSVLSSNITNNNNGWMPPYANTSTLDPDPVSAGLAGGTTGHAAFDWSYGLNAWGQYRYVDTADGKIVFGQKYLDPTTNTVKINWHTMALPLNFAPGTPATFQEDSNGDGTPDTNQTCTVSFATNSNGSAAIVTDTNGLNLPVVHVSCTDTPISGTTGGRSGTQSFYILAKYGAQVPDTDVVTGASLTWDQALHQYTRFGTITRDPTTGAATAFVSTTPDTIGTTTGNSDLSGTPMPDAALAATATATLRDNWLQYVDDNADQLDVYIPNGTSMADYFWVKYDQTSGQAATPLSWDTTTQTVVPLTGGSTTSFTVTELHYGISPASGSAGTLAFECTFRAWKPDPTLANGGALVDIGNTGGTVTATDSSTNPLTALAVTTTEMVDSGVICPSMTVPTVTQINAATGTTGWQDWDSTTQTSYSANSAELDLELVDTSTTPPTVVQSQSVNYYTVHN